MVNFPHFTRTSEFESRYKSTLKIKNYKIVRHFRQWRPTLKLIIGYAYTMVFWILRQILRLVTFYIFFVSSSLGDVRIGQSY